MGDDAFGLVRIDPGWSGVPMHLWIWRGGVREWRHDPRSIRLLLGRAPSLHGRVYVVVIRPLTYVFAGSGCKGDEPLMPFVPRWVEMSRAVIEGYWCQRDTLWANVLLPSLQPADGDPSYDVGSDRAARPRGPLRGLPRTSKTRRKLGPTRIGDAARSGRARSRWLLRTLRPFRGANFAVDVGSLSGAP